MKNLNTRELDVVAGGDFYSPPPLPTDPPPLLPPIPGMPLPWDVSPIGGN